MSQNLKEEYLDLIGDDYEKEGKNQGKNILTLRVRILTLILTLQGKNSYPNSYPKFLPCKYFPPYLIAKRPTAFKILAPPHHDDDIPHPSALLL